MVSQFRGWDSHSIKAAVGRSGKTLTELSLENGLHENSCSRALRSHHYRGEQAIISFLEVTGYELWPNRYDEDDVPTNPITRGLHLSELRPEGLRSKKALA